MRFILPLSLALVVGGCTKTAAQQTPTPAPTDVVATVGAATITLAQVDAKALQMPAADFGALKLAQALYEARRSSLDGLIDDLLVAEDAKSRGLDLQAVYQQEVGAKSPQPNETEVAAWYQTNQARLNGAALDQVREPIKAFIVRERAERARQEYVGRLKSKAAVRVNLAPPRQVVASAGRPTKGPATAPVEIIEFSDFQCPFCLSANPTVARVLTTYGDRIHFVYRHYPLPNHPNARPSAEAAQCADEQGKFWPFHDVLFANQSKLSEPQLKAHAAGLGLDVERFNACVDSHKYKAAVDADIKDGNEVGVNGTPAFFINGRLLSGAQPFEAFKRVIDEELALKAR